MILSFYFTVVCVIKIIMASFYSTHVLSDYLRTLSGYHGQKYVKIIERTNDQELNSIGYFVKRPELSLGQHRCSNHWGPMEEAERWRTTKWSLPGIKIKIYDAHVKQPTETNLSEVLD